MIIRVVASAALLASGVLIAAPQAVHAAAFQINEDSATGLGTAFSGQSSAAETPSTVFDNPAGMTQLPGLQVQLGGSVIVPSFTFHGSARSALGLPVSGADGRDGGNAALVPHGYLTYQATPQLWFGLALTSPFGLATSYGPDFVGRYQTDKTSLQTININPSVAYQVLPWLSLGAGVSAQYARADFSNYLNSQTIAYQATGRLLPLPDGYFRLKGDNWAFGYNFGALIQPGPNTNIGLAYRSRVEQTFEGSANFLVPAPLSLNPAFANSGGNAKLVLPDTATISLTQRVTPALTLYGEARWTNWSQLKNLNFSRDNGVPIGSLAERYHNSVFVSVGGSYKLTDKLVLRAGTAFDKTPVTDAYRSAQVPDANRYWLAGGFSYQILPGTAVDFGYAHIFVADSTINQLSATGDLLTGHYNNSVDIVSLGTHTRF